VQSEFIQDSGFKVTLYRKTYDEEGAIQYSDNTGSTESDTDGSWVIINKERK